LSLTVCDTAILLLCAALKLTNEDKTQGQKQTGLENIVSGFESV
jgi:hypothetical protein